MRSILVALLLLFFIKISAQTVKQPISITLEPVSKRISAGQRSALILELAIPEGIWLGYTKTGNRNPPATRIKMEKVDGFNFGEPQVPEPLTEFVPVHVGTTKVY